MTDRPTSELARAIQDVSDRTSLLIREEIELAKAEVSTKVKRLARGAAIGAAAGVFAIFALIYLLHGLAWLAWRVLPESIAGEGDVWVGYILIGVLLLLVGALAGFVAARLFKRGSPPTPQMAIEEAQLIRQTMTSPQPATLSGAHTSSTEVRS